MIEDVLFTLQMFLNSERVLHLPLHVYNYMVNENRILTSNDSKHIKK